MREGGSSKRRKAPRNARFSIRKVETQYASGRKKKMGAANPEDHSGAAGLGLQYGGHCDARTALCGRGASLCGFRFCEPSGFFE